MTKTLSNLNRRSFLKRSAAGAGALAAPALISSKALASSGEINFVGWAGYPALVEKVFPAFEAATGIKVNYDTFETNEALHAKLVAGNTGYDLVVPGTVFAKPQIEGGLLQPLDKSKIKNLANLDPALMATMTKADPTRHGWRQAGTLVVMAAIVSW